jgi:hypothetical protein
MQMPLDTVVPADATDVVTARVSVPSGEWMRDLNGDERFGCPGLRSIPVKAYKLPFWRLCSDCEPLHGPATG